MRNLILALIIILALSLPVFASSSVTSRVKLSIDGQMVTGALLKYDWGNNTGVITDFRTEDAGLIITGSKAVIKDRVIYIEDASITRCELPQPEYELYTRLLTYELETKRLTTKGTWIKVYGHKVMPEPSFSMVLDESRFGQLSREGMPRPVFGIDSVRGVYLGASYQTISSEEADSLVRGTLIYGEKTQWEGDVSYIHRAGLDGTITASWLRNPDYLYDLGGLQYDYSSPKGDLSLALGQYRQENEQILLYLPELKFSGNTDEMALGSFSLNYTPTIRIGQISSPQVGDDEALRLRAETSFSWRYPFAADFYLSGSGGVKTLFYSSPEDPESYSEFTETTYLKKQMGKWAFGLGHEGTITEGSPYFQELDPAGEKNNGLVSAGFNSNFGATRVSLTSVVKYNLDSSQFDTAVYSTGVRHNQGSRAFSSTLSLEQSLMTGSLTTATYSGNLNWDKWGYKADLKYDFRQAEWSKGGLTLTRNFHCYGLQAEYDIVEDKIGGKILFNW